MHQRALYQAMRQVGVKFIVFSGPSPLESPNPRQMLEWAKSEGLSMIVDTPIRVSTRAIDESTGKLVSTLCEHVCLDVTHTKEETEPLSDFLKKAQESLRNLRTANQVTLLFKYSISKSSIGSFAEVVTSIAAIVDRPLIQARLWTEMEVTPGGMCDMRDLEQIDFLRVQFMEKAQIQLPFMDSIKGSTRLPTEPLSRYLDDRWRDVPCYLVKAACAVDSYGLVYRCPRAYRAVLSKKCTPEKAFLARSSPSDVRNFKSVWAESQAAGSRLPLIPGVCSYCTEQGCRHQLVAKFFKDLVLHQDDGYAEEVEGRHTSATVDLFAKC